ncbi:hypothetical protein B0T12DRAFT_504305 [Alternaria alternata]|nr:hypothetical protein B0T12DRAFT_504305 [Alternaria alternata]
MHQRTISLTQGKTASGQRLDGVEPHVSDKATARSHGEPIHSHSSMNPVFQSDLDPFLAPALSPVSDAASEMSRLFASSKRTDCAVKHPPLPLLGRALGSRQTWRIPATILGFYFILSLVLVTAFRAALVASIGTCYTQFLWATLRKRVLKVSLIEDLFQVQTNPFHFFNYQLYFKTPVLVAVAIFCWLVPIATVYPPGTLVVEIQPSSIDISFNVSVFHHRNLLDISEDNVIGQVKCEVNCVNDTCTDHLSTSPQMTKNTTFLKTCSSQSVTNGMEYITSSNLIVGEISRLKQASQENTSYELSFFGTTLDCETTNRSMEYTISELSLTNMPSDHKEAIWQISNPAPNCTLTNTGSQWDVSLEDANITYRVVHDLDAPQYWPCLDKNQWMPNTDNISWLPLKANFSGWLDSGRIHSTVPVTETVCSPKIVEYHITMSNAAGAQHASYIIKKDVSIPTYTRDFDDFSGTFEQWAQLSDAVAIYRNFAQNFNQSGSAFKRWTFEYPSMSNETKPYTTEDGEVVETCVLGVKPHGKSYLVTQNDEVGATIWRLGVFEQRLDGGNKYDGCPAFDPDMANELLINTTISALALNQRFDMVNGTETLNFNAYHFENKLALILPYGLSLALAVPILVLGFIALYVQNHGVSAISGGFLQLLMTTTGRTSLEAVVTKGSGTLGGYENVSKELREMEVRFGELIQVSGEDQKETDTLLNEHEEHADVQEDGSSQSGLETTCGMERCEDSVSVVQRAGFGTVDEVGLFRKKGE